jgi:hypothetical protein
MLHDLRHTFASFGTSRGLGLPIIGKLLGHSQAATTARYAHLDNDPLRHSSGAIAGHISAAFDGWKAGKHKPLPYTSVIPMLGDNRWSDRR